MTDNKNKKDGRDRNQVAGGESFRLCGEEKDIHESHSIEAAHRLHDYKTKSKSNQEDE